MGFMIPLPAVLQIKKWIPSQRSYIGKCPFTTRRRMTANENIISI